jgi:predicted DNA binding CopG/RHH family protein
MKKSKIPKFKSFEEEAKFWDTHDTTEFLDELKEAKNIKFIKPRKRLISVRMDETQIKPLKEIASAKGIGYLTLIRMWIAERLLRERGLLHTHHG